MSSFRTDCATLVQSQLTAFENNFLPQGKEMNAWTSGKKKKNYTGGSKEALT